MTGEFGGRCVSWSQHTSSLNFQRDPPPLLKGAPIVQAPYRWEVRMGMLVVCIVSPTKTVGHLYSIKFTLKIIFLLTLSQIIYY